MRAGIEIPRDDCEWRAGDEGNMANRCDGDQIAVGACGGGFNNDCPGSADTALSLPTFIIWPPGCAHQICGGLWDV